MFSIVIPLYNKELSIKNTIQSVLEQTIQNFEIVVVNDGATDESARIVEKIEDDRIRLIHQENQGVSAARNRGIKEANYEWLSFLDADDYWYPNHLETTRKLILNFPKASVIATNWKKNFKKLIKNNKKAFYVRDYFKESLEKEIACSSVVTIKKSCFDKVGLFDEDLVYGEDRHMWIRLARYYKIAKTNRITAIYRLGAENRAIMKQDRGFDDGFIRKMIFEYKSSNGNKSFKKYIETELIRQFKRSLRYGKNILTIKKLFLYKDFIANKRTLYKYMFFCFLPVKYLNKIRTFYKEKINNY
jgi:glycosyltransferase involved in cell wall biosynthesis